MKQFVGHVSIVLLVAGCTSTGSVSSLFFSPSDDRKIGEQISQEIESNPHQYPLLSAWAYPKAYTYLSAMEESILRGSDIAYLEDFGWELKMIPNDDVLNAFCTPGAYICVYTRMIKYLERVDDLAGVMGHEITHADQRHSFKQMEKQYAISTLGSIALGNEPVQLAQMAGLSSRLKLSRSDKTEVDKYAVYYLADTEYGCNGAASFFQKLLDQGLAGGTPTFINSHPSSSNRVSDINEIASSLSCGRGLISETGMTYNKFKASLPT